MLLVAAGALAGRAQAATWVVHGRGFGHGVGMSQYGAYGLARHGRSYHGILRHYYRHTTIGKTGNRRIKVLLDSGAGSVGFRLATKACGKHLDSHRGYRFDQSGSGVILRTAGGRRLRSCGRAGTASGHGTIRIGGHGLYRGTLKAVVSGGLEIINSVGLDNYAKGVVPNEVPSSWPQAVLRAQAVAARSYALGVASGGTFDVYDDARSQVYGGKSSEAARTNRAVRGTSDRIVRYHKHVATTYFFSTSGGRTESIQFGFPGASPAPYLKSVFDPYDNISPFHTWKVRFSQSRIESKLRGLFSGRLRKIKVLKRGDSPRIVLARVVGSRGSSRISGPALQAQLGLMSNWARFVKK